MAEELQLKDPIFRSFTPGPTKFEKDLAAEQAKVAPEEPTRGFGEVWDDAKQTEFIHNLYLDRQNVLDKDDPEWTWDDQKVATYTDGIKDESLKDYILNGGGGSAESAQARYEHAKEVQDRLMRLDKDGLKGIGARVLASLVDPTELAATTALTAGAGTLVSKGVKVLKGGKMVLDYLNNMDRVKRTATIGAGVAMADNLVFEGIRTKLGPERDAESLFYSTLLAGPLGATIGGGTASLYRLAKRREFERLVEGGADLTPAERAYYEDVAGKANVDRIIEHLEGKANDNAVEKVPTFREGYTPIEEEDILQQLDLGRRETLGDDPKVKQEAPVKSTKDPDFSEDLDAFDDAPKILGSNVMALGLRKAISASAELLSHDVGKVRALAGAVMTNFSGWTNRMAVKLSAPEIQKKYAFQTDARFYRPYKAQFDGYKERTGGNREAFNLDISRYIAGDTSKTYDKAVIEMGERSRRIYKQFHEDAAAAKVLGFTGDAALDPNYLPRIFDNIRISRLAQDLKDGELTRLVEEAILRKRKNIGPLSPEDMDAVKKFSEIYSKAIVRRSTVYNPNAAKMDLSEVAMDELRDGLSKAFNGDDAKVEKVLDLVEGLNTQSKRPDARFNKRAKFRVGLDENTSMDLELKAGGTKTVRFDDLLHRDIEDLMQMYSYQMGGVIGLAKHGIGVEGGQTWDEIISQLEGELRDAALNGKLNDVGSDNIKKTLALLQFGHDSITGKIAYKDLETFNEWRANMSRLRTLSYIWNMGFAGFAAMLETANVILDTQVKSLVKGFRYFPTFLGKLKDGELKNELLSELEYAFGTGADVITNMRRNRFDPDEDIYFARSLYNETDNKLNWGREQVSKWSGLAPVTAALRRLSNLYFALDFHNAAIKAAKTGKDASPFSDIKMEQLGISKEMNKRIIAQINQHAELNGSKLKSLNLVNWTDKEAAQVFGDAGFKNAVTNVQESFNGSTNRIVRSELGRTVLQFMGYVLSSQEQQLQRYGARMANGDAGRVGLILTGTYFASTMAYVARVHFQASGMGEREREKFLEKRLSDGAMYKGGLNLTGWMSFYSLLFNGAGQMFLGSEERIINPPLLGMLGGISNGFYKTLADAVSDDVDMSDEEWRKVLKAGLGPLMRLPMTAPLMNRAITEIND